MSANTNYSLPWTSRVADSAQNECNAAYGLHYQNEESVAANPDMTHIASDRSPFRLSEDEGYASASLSPELRNGSQPKEATTSGSLAQSSILDAVETEYFNGMLSSMGPWYEPCVPGYDLEAPPIGSDVGGFNQEDKENLFPSETLACPSSHLHCNDHAHEREELPPLSQQHDCGSFPDDIWDRLEAGTYALPSLLSLFGPSATDGHTSSSAQSPPRSPEPMALFPGAAPGPSHASADTLEPPTPVQAQTPTCPAPRRSIRKRARPSDAPEPIVVSQPPRKKARTRKARPAAVAPAPAPIEQPVAGPSNVGRAREEESESAPEHSDKESDDDAHDPGADGTTTERRKRPRRTHREVVRNMMDLPLVACPLCDEPFDPKKHEANRAHLIRHYGAGAIKGSAPLVCLWEECSASVCGKRMITHVHAKHVGLAFVCPYAKCSWRGSRAKDLPQHLARDHKGDQPPP